MKPIAYDAAYDPYHTAFRMLRLCLYQPEKKHPKAKLRILDFYLNFPFLLKKFLEVDGYSLPKGGRGQLKKIDFDSITEPYSNLPDSTTIFRQMEIFQEAAMQTLCVRGFLDRQVFEAGEALALIATIPGDLKEGALKRNGEQESLMDFLLNFMADIEMEGPKGLKARTKLMEYRYDAI
jgi:hypothetical protein